MESQHASLSKRFLLQTARCLWDQALLNAPIPIKSSGRTAEVQRDPLRQGDGRRRLTLGVKIRIGPARDFLAEADIFPLHFGHLSSDGRCGLSRSTAIGSVR